MSGDAGWLTEFIRDVPDFPKPGIVFKDVTPLLADPKAFVGTIDLLGAAFTGARIDKVVGIEARGFIVAAPLAYRIGAGFVPVRKSGKLPYKVELVEYALEYGTDRLELHHDAVAPGERVLIIDDVLATGGTAAASVELVDRLEGEVVGLGFVLELGFLNGRARLPGRTVVSLITYE
jgi:adenine phosphoribosyltransferase